MNKQAIQEVLNQAMKGFMCKCCENTKVADCKYAHSYLAKSFGV